MEAAVEITDATFEAEVLHSPGLTIVDLWAEWCLPCKNLAPILDQIAEEYRGKIKVTKLDVDANPAVPGLYGVTGIPTLLVFKGGEFVESIVGFLPKDRLLKKLRPRLDEHLTGNLACGIRWPTIEYRQPKALNRTSTLESGASESPPVFRFHGDDAVR